MTEKEREELIAKMADAMFATDEDGTLRVDVMTRAALAVAEPVIREECAKIAESHIGCEISIIESQWCEAGYEIATTIREGGKGD